MIPVQVNLYSDTQSLPSAGMRQAIANAAVGDEQKGADPSVTELLARVKQILGKQDAIFLPSGTMANAIAVATHCAPGEGVLAETNAHILRYEAGGMAAITRVMAEPIAGIDGKFTADQMRAHFAEGSRYTPRTSLVCVEQSCNLSGGTVWRKRELDEISSVARDLGVKTHMDGARLFNAAISTDTSPQALCEGFDSVWVDFTKGLGAPFGAVLCGSKEFINKAWYWKHRLGGAMRQAGFMGAACLYALENNVARLAEDHDNATRLNEGLKKLRGVRVRHEELDTNIVYFSLDGYSIAPKDFLARCAERGLNLGWVGGGFRAVTYLNISRADIDRALQIVSDVLAVCEYAAA